jgi:hypothetical protein
LPFTLLPVEEMQNFQVKVTESATKHSARGGKGGTTIGAGDRLCGVGGGACAGRTVGNVVGAGGVCGTVELLSATNVRDELRGVGGGACADGGGVVRVTLYRDETSMSRM